MLNRDAMSFVDNRHLYLGECTVDNLPITTMLPQAWPLVAVNQVDY